MNKNSFVVRWHAPTDSEKMNREVMLKSEDLITMNEWLDAISSEALRTEEVKHVDWWIELFGQVEIIFFLLRITDFRFVHLIRKLFVHQFAIATHLSHTCCYHLILSRIQISRFPNLVLIHSVIFC
jgi:hypothetical protein